MNDEDRIIAKLKEENEYLKSLLRMHNISFEKPKEIKQVGERHLTEIPLGFYLNEVRKLEDFLIK